MRALNGAKNRWERSVSLDGLGAMRYGDRDVLRFNYHQDTNGCGFGGETLASACASWAV